MDLVLMACVCRYGSRVTEYRGVEVEVEGGVWYTLMMLRRQSAELTLPRFSRRDVSERFDQ